MHLDEHSSEDVAWNIEILGDTFFYPLGADGAQIFGGLLNTGLALKL